MDRFLRPEIFDIEPCRPTPGATKEWLHCFRTFENCFETLTELEGQPNKLNTLINYVSPKVYEYISEHTTYDEAIAY